MKRFLGKRRDYERVPQVKILAKHFQTLECLIIRNYEKKDILGNSLLSQLQNIRVGQCGLFTDIFFNYSRDVRAKHQKTLFNDDSDSYFSSTNNFPQSTRNYSKISRIFSQDSLKTVQILRENHKLYEKFIENFLLIYVIVKFFEIFLKIFF